MTTHDEKVLDAGQLEKTSSGISDRRNNAIIDEFSPEEKKKLIRRIDKRLVLTLGFMYCVSLMDRTNTGVAVVAGMGVDLVFIGSRYSIMVLVFFLTYVFLQPPATVVLRKVGPRIFLPLIVILWGLTTIGIGFVKVWTDLIPLRLLLGVFEAGFFPGCAYLLSCWYPRYELQRRNAVFYLIGSMSSAFSGILAYGFSELAGKGAGADWMGYHFGPTEANPTAPKYFGPGLSGWRWIFILQGALTVIVGMVGWYFIVDFPELAAKKSFFGANFLNEREAAFIVARIEKDRHDAIPETFAVGKYLKHALDLKVWGFATLFMCSTTISYAIAYFLPIILNEGMGFNRAASQCLIAPPYVLAAIVMFAFAWYGDKWHMRSPFILANGVLALIGLPLMGFVDNVGARYFGVFLATTAANANIPTQDSPEYVPGITACMVAAAVIVIVTLLLDIKFSRANKRAAAGGKAIEGLEGFRYTL
ncbi:hypothetical protein LTR70_010250 [Exophiala xenobiotica]|uniref:Major facilitator superfamily (MFS) profile domain-containing protein n=1 Tax=Lithohypha guttulata TaxID=1690604 RepID=A0ABR0JUW2_9EURO|nr:hypothetical protein LTR24_010263 [Lithohypha guttulata]KAK5309484.1 hypothetical protein LTR70_010250 [Exophiala xenobiotica]